MSTRATSEAAKAERRNGILAAAAEAFDRLGYADVSMNWLAERAGVAKGTLYLYFPTKESVFLGVYRRELARWFDAVDAGLASLPKSDIARTVGLLVDCLADQPRLTALAAVLHGMLERNIDEREALAFRSELMDRLVATGAALEQRLDFLPADDGVRLLLRLHAFAVGCWQLASPAPAVRRVTERPTLAAQRLDFSEELENVLVLLLEGWRQKGGGF